MKEGEGLTWSQFIYWLTCVALILGGLAMASCSHLLPWGWLQAVVKDLGTGLLIAGILASFVEPFFRKEFARDAFLAAFRRVLPDEFNVVLTREYRHTRQALVHKYIRRKPTVREARALNTAALLVVRAEFAATDPSVTPDMLTKLVAAARRAHAFLAEVAAERRAAGAPSSIPLAELVDRARQTERARS